MASKTTLQTTKGSASKPDAPPPPSWDDQIANLERAIGRLEVGYLEQKSMLVQQLGHAHRAKEAARIATLERNAAEASVEKPNGKGKKR